MDNLQVNKYKTKNKDPQKNPTVKKKWKRHWPKHLNTTEFLKVSVGFRLSLLFFSHVKGAGIGESVALNMRNTFCVLSTLYKCFLWCLDKPKRFRKSSMPSVLTSTLCHIKKTCNSLAGVTLCLIMFSHAFHADLSLATFTRCTAHSTEISKQKIKKK